MKLDFKKGLLYGSLVVIILAFCYTTTTDIDTLSLNNKAMRTENHDIRYRLDRMDKKISRLKKQIRELQK